MSDSDRCATMFASLGVESRRYVLAVLQGEYDRAQRNRRPALRVIEGGKGVMPISGCKRQRRTK